MVLLLFFRRTPASRAPKWGVVFYLVPTLFTLLLHGLWQLAQLDAGAAAAFEQGLQAGAVEFAAQVEAQRAAYGPEGSFAAATLQRLADLESMLGYLLFFGPLVLGMFLIGAGLMRSGALLQPQAHLPLFRRLRFWGYLGGVPMVLGSFALVQTIDFTRLDGTAVLAQTLMSFGSLALCLAYMATLLLALQRADWAARLAWLAPAGQMALTNYLTQSLLCVGLFYGYGLGFFEQLPRAWQPLFVFALFGLQVVLSRWWLARFRFGPAEWLWRALTYLRIPPPGR